MNVLKQFIKFIININQSVVLDKTELGRYTLEIDIVKHVRIQTNTSISLNSVPTIL